MCRSARFARRKSRRCKDKRAACLVKSQVRYQSGQQYSITALTDSTGTIKERYAYSAYGTPTITDASGTACTATSEGNRYTYTGREWEDIAKLYHYRARPFDPLTGRLLSRDPMLFLNKHCPECGRRFEAYRRMLIGRNNLRAWPCPKCKTMLRFDRMRRCMIGALLSVPIMLMLLAESGKDVRRWISACSAFNLRDSARRS